MTFDPTEERLLANHSTPDNLLHNQNQTIIAQMAQSFVDLKFKTIVNDLDIPEFGNHDSYNDAIMTAMIFLKLKNHPNVKIK